MRSALIAGLAVIILVFSGGAPSCAEPEVFIKKEDYKIHGYSAEELRSQMDQKGILGKDGRRYDAYTDWRVTWRYENRKTDLGCRAASAETRVDVLYQMPKWTHNAGADPLLKKRWETYLEALETHEKGHEEIGTDAAREIERRISTLGWFKRCSDLDAAVSQAAQAILSEYRQKELFYDQETSHGRTQDAAFP